MSVNSSSTTAPPDASTHASPNGSTDASPDGTGRRDWWIECVFNPRLLVLVLSLIAVAGLTSLMDLPRMEDPVLANRVGLINTPLPGADAARVEALVSEPIEDELRDIEEIKELRSVSRQGISTISVELLDSVSDTDPVWSRVRARIDDAAPRLPVDAGLPQFEELQVRAYALIVGISWRDRGPPDVAALRRVAIDLQDRLQGLPGTDVVDRFGDPGEEIEVELNAAAVAASGMTPADVATRIASRDVKSTAGELLQRDRQLLLEIGNQFEHSREIAETVIGDADNRDIRVGDLATIRVGMADPPPRMAILDGEMSVALGVMVRPNFRIDRYTAAADQTLADFAALMPSQMALTTVLRQSNYVDSRLASLTGNLWAGAAAVSVVVFLLMGFRSAVLVVLTLPLASLMVLFFLKTVGIPIHQMSITGLIISMGLLIDNAIVIVDEVRSRIARGIAASVAASASVRHLAVPLLGSTITTALAFAPIALMPGPAGEFVGSIAISVIASVFASLFLSLTIIPALTALWSRDPASGSSPRRSLAGPSNPGRSAKLLASLSVIFHHGISIPPITQVYRRCIGWFLAHPIMAIAVSMTPPLVGFTLAGTLQEQFFPPSTRDQFHVTIERPATSSLARTRDAAQQVDQIIRRAGARRTDWFLGESAPQFYYNVMANRRGTRNFAQCLVTLSQGVDPTQTIRRLQTRLRDALPDSRVLVRQLEQGPPVAAPIEVRLFGPDPDVLRQLGDAARLRLSRIEDVVYTRSDLSEVLPMVSIDVDPTAAIDAGLDPADVGDYFRAALNGVPAGNVLQDNQQVPVVVRLGDAARGDLAAVSSMDIAAGPDVVPLSAVSDIRVRPRPAAITRLNRRRMNEVAAYINAGILPSVVQASFEQSLVDEPLGLPPGYSIRYGGIASGRDDAVGNLFSTVGILAVLMVATLVLALGSFRATGVIGGVAIGSVGLALLSLVVGGYPFGFMAIIGAMGLIWCRDQRFHRGVGISP